MKLRLLLLLLLPSSAAIAAVAACSDETDTKATNSPDGSAPRRDGSTGDDDDGAAGEPDADAAASGPDANGPNEAGDPCSFNRDCNASLRCECAEGDCTCKAGARGTGRLGDPCDSGNHCLSANCIDDKYCTEECEAGTDCKDPYPQCLDVVFVGSICAPRDQ